MSASIKRSEVNRIMRESDAFIRSFGYIMPPFAYWSPEEMKARKADSAAIFTSRLGWDMWMYNEPPAHDAEDAVFVSEGLPLR